jgi:hypothetical protein
MTTPEVMEPSQVPPLWVGIAVGEVEQASGFRGVAS